MLTFCQLRWLVIREDYTWELMREEGRWRINGWEAEVSGGLR